MNYGWSQPFLRYFTITEISMRDGYLSKTYTKALLKGFTKRLKGFSKKYKGDFVANISQSEPF